MSTSTTINAGDRFGNWTVLMERSVFTGGRRRRGWLCRCICGTEKSITGDILISGKTTQCQICGNRQKAALKSRLVHGLTDTRLHRIWMQMRRRCEKPSCPDYPRYGGRGISVCPQWHKFEPFYEWANATGYSDGLTLDRRDNDGGYEPNNCRWATRTEQNRNRRDNVRFEFRGQNLTIPEIAEITGFPAAALRLRLIRYGMSIEIATTKPLRKRAA